MNTTLEPSEFQQLIDNLCARAAADFAETRRRLERLRLIGPDDERGHEHALPAEPRQVGEG